MPYRRLLPRGIEQTRQKDDVLNKLILFSVQKEGFFDQYEEKDCVKLDHVTSHLIYNNKDFESLDMICRIYSWYHFSSFAKPQTYTTSLKNNAMNIIKVEDNYTLFSFKRNKEGLASLYFESVEDAKKFNRDVYPPLKAKLEVTIKMKFWSFFVREIATTRS